MDLDDGERTKYNWLCHSLSVIHVNRKEKVSLNLCPFLFCYRKKVGNKTLMWIILRSIHILLTHSSVKLFSHTRGRDCSIRCDHRFSSSGRLSCHNAIDFPHSWTFHFLSSKDWAIEQSDISLKIVVTNSNVSFYHAIFFFSNMLQWTLRLFSILFFSSLW